MLTKNQTLKVTIDNADGMMNGVAHADGQAVFIPGALPNEQVTIQIVKTAKSYAFGRLISIEERSPFRVSPPCPCYQQCGGCSALHMTYAASLELKRASIEQVLRRIGGVEIAVPPVLGMDEPFHYRNKTAMPVGGFPSAPQIGFFAPRSHRLVPVSSCLISKKESDQIAGIVLAWMKKYGISPYNEITGSGLVRHVMSRVSRAGESMAVIVTSKEALPHQSELIDMLKRQVKGLVSICQSVNPRGDNVILGSSYRVLYGSPRLNDTLCGFSFALSPLSFFQINPVQTEKLYALALSFAAPTKEDIVADLYCGAGTISLLLAQKSKQVIGIEIVPQAVLDAKENARTNNISNVEFHQAAAEELLPKLVESGLRPDVVVLDPPRKGAEPEVLNAIAQAAPKRVVYVSCDPATQARDIRILCENGYHLEKVQPVDMFSWTAHVENVALLSKEEN